jgi:heme A synthase
MPTTIDLRYRTLAIIAVVAVYLLIIAGAVVRVSGSGLGCPDWPTCHGTLAPPVDKGMTAIIEYTHRVVAGLSGIPLALTIFFAWKSYRQVRWIFIPANLMLILLPLQIGLGGVVVLTELQPVLVVIHLGIALSILACALAIAVYAGHPAGAKNLIKGTPRQLQRLYITLAALFTVLMIGAAVVGSNTSMACPDWPLCNSNLGVILFPPANVSPVIWFHLIHRYSVLLFTLWLGWVVYATLKEQGSLPAFRLWAILLAVFFVLQVTVGATQVLLQKPAWLRATHLGVAAAVWVALVVLTLLNYLGVSGEQSAAS